MLAANKRPEPILAYLVASVGTSGSGRSSSWSAKSVADRTGLTYRESAKALASLVEDGVITNVGTTARPRWNLPPFEDAVQLPNDLANGVGHGEKPLSRILSRAPFSLHGRKVAQVDALTLLLAMYAHHDLAGSGGVTPSPGLYRRWNAVENAFKTKIEGTDGHLVEIEGENEVASHQFIEDALPHAPEPDRFWAALALLKAAGLVFEVITIWTDEPRHGELLYTLYVRDWHARQRDTYVQPAIHRLCLRSGTFDPATEMGCDDSIVKDGMSNEQFRFVAITAKPCALGIYRLRFIAPTRDEMIGLERERQRNQEWMEALDSI